MQHHVYLSLGSNLGDKKENLRQAIHALQSQVGSLVACSAFIATEPWGFDSKNTFLNAAVHLTTQLTPRQLLIATQQIERQLGRTSKSSNKEYHDRTIDIDILTYDTMQIDETFTHDGLQLSLTLPHPLMHERDFVMIPLNQICFD